MPFQFSVFCDRDESISLGLEELDYGSDNDVAVGMSIVAHKQLKPRHRPEV